MSATARPIPRGRWPLGLLGMLALVVAVESFLARHTLDFTSIIAAGYAYPARNCRATRPGEILCFGDSLMKFGVLPRVFETRLGTRTTNLAIPGGLPAASFFLFRRAVEAGARPSVVLVSFKPTILQGRPRDFAPQLAALANARESLELAWAGQDAGL